MKISNSEVGTYLKCERRHYYAHGLNLMPKRYGTSLTRGIIGHEALEKFYRGQIDGLSLAEAKEAMNAVIVQHIVEGTDPIMLGSLATLLEEYTDKYGFLDSFKPIAVEETMGMPIAEDIEYAMRFDLLAEMRTGMFAGEIVLIDHKFVYNFWDQDALMLNAQGPKYIATMRANDIPVKRMMVNQLRWREVKSNPVRFQREWITPVAAEIKNVLREQSMASVQIAERLKDLTEYGDTALRTMDNMTCKNCSFAMLCRVELIGEDPTLLIETDFQPNTYGYNTVEGDEV